MRGIVGNLNLKLIPTKQNGIWQADTVRGDSLRGPSGGSGVPIRPNIHVGELLLPPWTEQSDYASHPLSSPRAVRISELLSPLWWKELTFLADWRKPVYPTRQ